MKKRLIVITIAAVFLISGSISQVFADTQITDMALSSGVVTVKGVTDEPYITYTVYPFGESVDVTNMAGMGEIYVDDGDFAFDFGLDISGSFTISVHDGKNYVTRNVNYAPKKDRDIFIEKINNALRLKSDDTLNELLTNSENRAVIETIGIDYDTYLSYSGGLKSGICKAIVSNHDESEMNEENFRILYDICKNLSKINIVGSSVSEEVLSDLNYSFENIEHKNIKNNSQRVWIARSFAQNAPYSSVDDMKVSYNRACALYFINTAKTSNIENTIKKYSDILSIANDRTYIEYESKSSSSVNRALVDSLSKSPAYTVNDFIAKLDSAMPNNDAENGGGSSKSGKGGVSSSTVKSTVEINAPAPELNNGLDDTPEQNTGLSLIFNDMNSEHWAFEAVNSLKLKGVINGYGDGRFLPEQTVSREEFVKMIIAAFGLEKENASSHFYDVFDDDWFYPYVSAAFEYEIVKGNDRGLFGVKSNITRQDAAVIAARTMDYVGISPDKVREYTGFDDENVISDYAADSIKTLYCAGKINGMDKGTFEPLRYCTRAEAAAIIYGILK